MMAQGRNVKRVQCGIHHPLFPESRILGSRLQDQEDPSQSSMSVTTSETGWPGPREELGLVQSHSGGGRARACPRTPGSWCCHFLVRPFQSSGKGGCSKGVQMGAWPLEAAAVVWAECMLCHFLAPGSVGCADYKAQ